MDKSKINDFLIFARPSRWIADIRPMIATAVPAAFSSIAQPRKTAFVKSFTCQIFAKKAVFACSGNGRTGETYRKWRAGNADEFRVASKSGRFRPPRCKDISSSRLPEHAQGRHSAMLPIDHGEGGEKRT
jgi:hypothetical protein